MGLYLDNGLLLSPSSKLESSFKRIVGSNFNFLVGCDSSSIGPHDLNPNFVGTIKIGLLTLLFVFPFESLGWMFFNVLSLHGVPLLAYASSLMGLLLFFSGTLSLVGPPLLFCGSIVVVVESPLLLYNFSALLLELPLLIFCGTSSFDGVPMLTSTTFPLFEVCVITFGGCPLVGVPLLTNGRSCLSGVPSHLVLASSLIGLPLDVPGAKDLARVPPWAGDVIQLVGVASK